MMNDRLRPCESLQLATRSHRPPFLVNFSLRGVGVGSSDSTDKLRSIGDFASTALGADNLAVGEIDLRNDAGESVESHRIRESRRRRVSIRRQSAQITIVIPQGFQVLAYVLILVLALSMLVEVFLRR